VKNNQILHLRGISEWNEIFLRIFSHLTFHAAAGHFLRFSNNENPKDGQGRGREKDFKNVSFEEGRR